MTKKIMILGASHLQVPAIMKAKEKGFEVAAVDIDEKAIGATLVDKFYKVSTNDKIGVFKACADFQADGLMTLATDMPMRSVAYTAEKLNLPGISCDTAYNSTDKGEMIKAFKQFNVASPWFYIINSLDELITITSEISFPCIIKPVDSAGSRGVIFVANSHELKNAYRYSVKWSKIGRVIVEEYMEGPEVSVETLTYKGKTEIINITDKYTSGSPNFIEIGHSQPTILSEEDKEQIKKLATEAVMSLGISMGPAHVEIILTNEGPKVVEVGARLGGDCITTHLIPLSTGIDMVGLTLDLSVGKEISVEPLHNQGSAIRFITCNNGIITKIEGLKEAQQIDGIKEVKFLKNVGDIIVQENSSLDRIGYIISYGTNAIEAIEKCDKALRLIKIEMMGCK